MWLARANKFTRRYFNRGHNYDEKDETKTEHKLLMTYCLKDVNAWKTWCDLKRTYRPVDWTQFVETHDTTKFEGESACAGGACELKRF